MSASTSGIMTWSVRAHRIKRRRCRQVGGIELSFYHLKIKFEDKGADLLLPNYQNFDLWICKCVPCGLVARIRRSHRRGRGSIPRTGDSNFASPVQCPGRLCLQDWKCSKRLMHCKMKMQGILLIIWLIDDFFHRKTFPKKILPKTKTELDLIGLLV